MSRTDVQLAELFLDSRKKRGITYNWNPSRQHPYQWATTEQLPPPDLEPGKLVPRTTLISDQQMQADVLRWIRPNNPDADLRLIKKIVAAIKIVQEVL